MLCYIIFMMMLIILQFLFILYYTYAFYVFYKLNENTCSCEKLEGFKKTKSFQFLFYSSFLFLVYNCFYFTKLWRKHMIGGGDKMDLIMRIYIMISIGYGFVFVYDYVLLRFFATMKEKKCPCQVKHRGRLTQFTHVKLAINIYSYLSTLYFANKSLSSFDIPKLKKQFLADMRK